ncbi:hypothetical protein [Myxococcus faecalis]|uniref:hypothetical protein n=1 Tax=Myxococcus faecalis TaxID=3115646 RepID=UPI003CEA9C4E
MHVTWRAVSVLVAGSLMGCPDNPPSERADSGTPVPRHHVIIDAGWDESAQRLHAVMAVERNGGTITVPNRDGSTTRIVSRVEDGGTRIIQYFNNQGTLPVLTTRSVGEGSTHWGDYDEDSRPDYHYDRSFDDAGVMVQVWLDDTNRDGEFDRRRTQLGDRGDLRVIQERMMTLDGGVRAWRVESDEEVPAIQPHPDEEKDVTWAAGSCDSMAGFPADLTSTTSMAALPAIHIVTGPATGACSPEQTARILEALEKLPAGVECLVGVNSTLGAMLKGALSGSITTNIGCGGQCPGIRAATDPGPPSMLGELRSGPYRINIAPRVVAASQGLDRTLLHELLHWSTGLKHAAVDDGTDQVWSCSRFCSRCTLDGFGGGDPAADCARCSDGSRKMSCGSKQVENVMGSCEVFAGHVAGSGVDPALTSCRVTDYTFYRCSTCAVAQASYCDGTPIPFPLSFPTGYATAYRCCRGCYMGEPVRDCSSIPPLPADATTCNLPVACGTL